MGKQSVVHLQYAFYIDVEEFIDKGALSRDLGFKSWQDRPGMWDEYSSRRLGENDSSC